MLENHSRRMTPNIRKLCAFFLLVLTPFFSSLSNAALIAPNLVTVTTSGYNSVVDLSTGLQWMHLSYTHNISYDDVSRGVQLGQYGDYRYATREEAANYYNEFGIPIGREIVDIPTAELNTAVDLFFEHMGQLNTISTLTETWAMTETLDEESSYAPHLALVRFTNVPPYIPGSIYYQTTGVQYGNKDIASIDAGSLLVRQAFEVQPVPVPAAMWLFSSALISLFGLKRKK